MGPTQDLTKIVDEMRETLQFLEKQLEAGSRIELIIKYVEDILESLSVMISDTSTPENIRIQAETLYIKSRYISEKAKDMLYHLEKETRDLRPRSKVWD